MKSSKTASQLQEIIRDELKQHHDVPPNLMIEVIQDGSSWRASCTPDPDAPEQGDLIARAVEVGDELARRYDLAG